VITAIRNGKVFLPAATLQEVTVLISGDSISGVGVEGQGLEVPPGAAILDARGKTVMPGLIDLHTHLTIYQDPALLGAGEGRAVLRGAHLAFQALRAGITAMRDMGGYHHVDIDLRNAIDEGLILGPKLLCAGKVIATTGGHIYYVAREADGPYEVRKAAREQLKAGAGSIEHGSFLDSECADLMAEKGCFLVPTFSVYAFLASIGPTDLRDRAKRVSDRKYDSFRLAVNRGVPWGVGTDSGAFSPMKSLIDEIIMTAETGISNVEILRHATAENAKLVSLTNTGSLAQGKKADIILVDGDPVSKLRDLDRVTHTIRNGVIYEWATWPGA
jgi:imidazolonepropionase-like amidohydrolase